MSESNTPSLLRRLRPELLLLVLGMSLTGCGGGGGGGGSDEPPAPPAPPPPPPGPTLPPLSSTVVNIDDGHTVGAQRWSNGNTSTGGQGQPVAGLDCQVNLPETYHAHAHLSVFLNGEALAIPNSVGIVQSNPTTTCLYPLHTHNASGLLHAEAAAPATFTLGQFFQVWGQPLTSSDIAGLTGMPVKVYVVDNGVVTENTGDWTAIELRSRRQITIQVGTAINEIPNFTWTGN